MARSCWGHSVLFSQKYIVIIKTTECVEQKGRKVGPRGLSSMHIHHLTLNMSRSFRGNSLQFYLHFSQKYIVIIKTTECVEQEGRKFGPRGVSSMHIHPLTLNMSKSFRGHSLHFYQHWCVTVYVICIWVLVTLHTLKLFLWSLGAES